MGSFVGETPALGFPFEEKNSGETKKSCISVSPLGGCSASTHSSRRNLLS
jgi:hypothetical protein